MEGAVVTDLSTHLALITGASGGIGYATAKALASMKCGIAVHYNANSAKAEELVAALKQQGVRAQCFQADLSSYDDTRRLHAEVVQGMGHPTILFNNAGLTLGKSGVTDIGDISVEDFETTWRANCATSYLLTQLCIPDMVKNSFGRVIFCSSVAGLAGGIVGPHYASSKSALHGLIHWLANTYAKQGITVNGVAPALITETAILTGTSESLSSSRWYFTVEIHSLTAGTTEIPIGRLGKPEEIAETVVWMVKTGYVTNKVIAVDGGLFVQ